MYVCVCVCIYIYIYIYKEKGKKDRDQTQQNSKALILLVSFPLLSKQQITINPLRNKLLYRLFYSPKNLANSS